MKSLLELKDAYNSAKQRARGFVALRHVTNPLLNDSDKYIRALELRVKDLEAIIHALNESESSMNPAQDLGHINGFTLLYWLDIAYRDDIRAGKEPQSAGIRVYDKHNLDGLIALSKRGYVSIANDACWIRDAGLEYMEAFKETCK